MALLSPVLGVPIIKMMPVLAFNFMIAATNASIGKWKRHAVAPSDNFFYAGAIFKIFVKKCKKWK